jgi:hypothetical protein
MVVSYKRQGDYLIVSRYLIVLAKARDIIK